MEEEDAEEMYFEYCVTWEEEEEERKERKGR